MKVVISEQPKSVKPKYPYIGEANANPNQKPLFLFIGPACGVALGGATEYDNNRSEVNYHSFEGEVTLSNRWNDETN